MAIGHRYLGQLATVALHPAGGDGGDLGQHGHLLAIAERSQVGQLAVPLVPARVMAQQVTDGVQVKAAGEDLRRLRVEHPVEPLVKPGHGSPE
jgi:hypothetical protein